MNKYQSKFIISFLLGIVFIPNTLAADFENPPSLNIEIPAEENNQETTETPPELNIQVPEASENNATNNEQENNEKEEDDDNENNNQDRVRIEEHEVFPRTVNLADSKPEISYTISDDARVRIQILDSDEEVVVQIFNDEVEAGEHKITWNGSDTNDQSGNLVNPGKYFYQIEAINEETDRIDDTEEGEINVVANNNPETSTENDFESSNETNQTNNATNETTSNNNANSQTNSTNSENNSLAVMEMQNRQSGRSAETGPEIYLYILLASLGFLFPLCYKK